jgi:hypothetical protein
MLNIPISYITVPLEKSKNIILITIINKLGTFHLFSKNLIGILDIINKNDDITIIIGTALKFLTNEKEKVSTINPINFLLGSQVCKTVSDS